MSQDFATIKLPALYAPRTSKIVVLSLTTLGFYLVYWGYKNWAIMRESGRTRAWAPICGFFLPFTLFSLLDKVEAVAGSIGVSARKLNGWAIGFLLINLLKMIPIVGILFSLLTFLALLPINRTFAKINRALQNFNPKYENFNRYNIAWLVLVAVWFTYHLVNDLSSRL